MNIKVKIVNDLNEKKIVENENLLDENFEKVIIDFENLLDENFEKVIIDFENNVKLIVKNDATAAKNKKIMKKNLLFVECFIKNFNVKNLNEKIFVENDAIENVTADDNNVNEKVNIENVIVKNLIEIIIVDND